MISSSARAVPKNTALYLLRPEHIYNDKKYDQHTVDQGVEN